MFRQTVFFLLTVAACGTAAAADAPPPMTKDQCLACHGPFEKLVKKDFKIEAVPNPINPHVFVPHIGQTKDFFDCLLCHQQHTIPPEKGYHDKSATLDACFGCHHTEEFAKCSSCHKK